MDVLTAKMTAKLAEVSGWRWTMTDCRGSRSNLGGHWWTVVDAGPAVFKTVCGLRESKPLGASRYPVDSYDADEYAWRFAGDASDNCNTIVSMPRARHLCVAFDPDITRPDPERHELYLRSHGVYSGLHAAMAPAMHELHRLS